MAIDNHFSGKKKVNFLRGGPRRGDRIEKAGEISF
jgi:hypothetical protein